MSQHYLDNQWVETDRLAISVLDLAVLRGFGIFDLFRTYKQRPFRINDHLDRFEKSAELMGMKIPLSRQEIIRLAEEGIVKNGFPETTIRLVLTGGVSEDAITPGKPSFIILFKPVQSPPAEVYAQGVSVITWPSHRSLPEAKTLNYSEAVLAMRQARQQYSFEAIYSDPTDKQLFEGTGTNIFVVRDSVIATPPAGVLPGITRKVVIELAKKLGMECRQEKVFMDDLPTFSEAFITSTTRQVVPVVKIDKTVVGDGKVGTVSRQLKTAFEQLVQSN